MTTQTENRTNQMKDQMGKMGQETKDSAQKVAGQSNEAWQQAKHDPTPKGLMGALESLPSSAFLYGTLGSIGLSAVLRLAGRKDFANFVGQWPPTILALAMMSKILRPSREM